MEFTTHVFESLYISEDQPEALFRIFYYVSLRRSIKNFTNEKANFIYRNCFVF